MTFLFNLFFCIFIGKAGAESQVAVIRYPAPESATDFRHNDLIEITDAALKVTIPKFGKYRLEPTPEPMTEARALLELKDRKNIDLVWSSTSTKKENDYLPIRIPLRKGILGYRICLVNKSSVQKIKKVKTISDLQKILIGQGNGWGDVELYETSGVKVSTAEYDALFEMLDKNRFDIFPRGLNEIFNEYEIYHAKNPNIEIEQSLLIHYPWPFYAFVNKNNNALKERLQIGLRLTIKNGTFNKLFQKYNSKSIQLARISRRHVIEIKNPDLPKETPLDDKELWFSPYN